MSLPEGPITCLFTDIVGSTQMSRHLSDAEYKRVIGEHDKRLRASILAKQGHEVDTAGDSFFATFQHTRHALECAVAMQTTLRDDPIVGMSVDDEGNPEQWPTRIRIGVYRAGREVFLNGEGKYRDREINLASRIGAIGEGGQILVSQSAHQGLEGEYNWQEWPGRYLKDFDTPQDIYELLWDGRSRSAPGARFLPDWYRRELNQFVGRKDMLAQIRDWLRESRYPLYTLQGFGGIGKTRLAVETVLTVGSLFPGGSVFVALDREIMGTDAQSITPALLAAAIARAANAPKEVQIDPEKHLAAWFATRKSTLFILDNWESAANTLATAWLGRFLNETPAVRCLATSRVVMGLTTMGQNRHIPALPIPAATSQLENFDAYNLFVTRAQQRDPECSLRDGDALLRILCATSGIPLGIELAAARIVDYPLDAIAGGLEQSLLDWQRTRDDLGDVRPDAERHSSLDASLNWSLNLLPPDERLAFPRLGLFAHDFDAATAQAMGDIPEDWLLRWHRASLLERTADRMRYQLLPVVPNMPSVTCPTPTLAQSAHRLLPNPRHRKRG